MGTYVNNFYYFIIQDEIQKWLSLSDEELAHWRHLGSGFMAWSLR